MLNYKCVESEAPSHSACACSVGGSLMRSGMRDTRAHSLKTLILPLPSGGNGSRVSQRWGNGALALFGRASDSEGFCPSTGCGKDAFICRAGTLRESDQMRLLRFISVKFKLKYWVGGN